MGTYNVPVYKRQQDGSLVVSSGGKIVMQTGALLVPNSETQAATVAAVDTATIAWTTADKGRVNSVITALKNVGILATS